MPAFNANHIKNSFSNASFGHDSYTISMSHLFVFGWWKKLKRMLKLLRQIIESFYFALIELVFCCFCFYLNFLLCDVNQCRKRIKRKTKFILNARMKMNTKFSGNLEDKLCYFAKLCIIFWLANKKNGKTVRYNFTKIHWVK